MRSHGGTVAKGELLRGFGLNSCIKNVIVMKEKKSVKSKIFRFYAGSGVL